MGRQCNICYHPNRNQIEISVNDNATDLKAIAKLYGVSYMALYRHKQAHMGPDAIRQAALGASQLNTSAIAELKANALDVLPDDYKPTPGQIDAYRDMLYLRDKAVALLERVESKVDEKGIPTISTTEMSIAMRELRETTKTMVQVYETQKRIEKEYSPPETVTGSFIYNFLRAKYPGVLLELTAAVRKEADQGQADKT